MSKELTELWRNGKLPKGWYYMIDCTGKEWFRYLLGVKPDADFIKCFKEVLAQVPSYTDLCELKQELEICKEEKADLYAKLCNALMQLESKNNQIADLSKKVERLQEQLDIVTEQRNDIHIDKQVLQKQLNEANRIIKKLYKESGNPIGCDYLERYGVK